MIQVNLLPAELRKRAGSSISPEFVSIALGSIAILLMVALLWWVDKRVKISEQVLADAQVELANQERDAKRVDEINKQIAQIEVQVKELQALFDSKVYQTKMLDDFADLFGQEGNFNQPDMAVSVQSFSLKKVESAGGRGKKKKRNATTAIAYKLNVQFHIYGTDLARSGDYIRAFFEGVQASPFWNEHNFQGLVEESYRGDTPKWHAQVGLAEVASRLDFVRHHIPGEAASATKAKAANAKGGS